MPRIKPFSLTMPVETCVVGPEAEERGYALGALRFGGLPFHVEAIRLVGEGNSLQAANSRFQGRIDNWLDKNGDERPCLLHAPDGHVYFIHVEVYAR